MTDKTATPVIPHRSVTESLSYLTGDLPGVGGVIKQRVEDFIVEEQPLYEASGEGEHLMLLIERANQTTTDVIRQLARVFRVGRRDVGYAGMKDKLAVTRQYFTIHLPGKPMQDEALQRLADIDYLKLLQADRHRNKLRRGHLAGNRFTINIRNVEPTAVVAAKKNLDILVATGVPNYVGPQRFGYRQVNHELGRLLLTEKWQAMLDLMLGKPSELDMPATRAGRQAYEQGDYVEALNVWPRHLRHDRQALDALRQGKTPRQTVMSIDRLQRQFLVSSLQSYLFNQVVDKRLRDGGLCKLVEGDLAWIHQNRAVFAVDGETAEMENATGGRIEPLDISPSGPMWGDRMTLAQSTPGEIESRVLEEADLSMEQLSGGKQGSAKGVRRPMRTPLIDPEISSGADEHGPYLRLAFQLQRGCFATMALREIMKVTMDSVDTSTPQELD